MTTVEKEQYHSLFENITAMLLAQGLNPNPNEDEMYITFDPKIDIDKITAAVNEEVAVVFGTAGNIKRCKIKQGINTCPEIYK